MRQRWKFSRKKDAVLESVNDLKEINVKNQTRHNASCRFRSWSEILLQNSKLDQLEKKKLKQNMEVSLSESAAYLFEKLRISELVVHDTQFLGH